MKPVGVPRRPRHRDAEAGGASYRRHVDSAEAERHRKRREVHLAFRAERYQPLVEEDVKEEKKTKKEKYKRVKKNVGKALRSTWKCLMLGLYNFALGYSTPVTAAATFVPHFTPGRNRS
ncbi:required for drug-induced death protein 1-like [Corythoichthys intestinalis]|uniref:required for drug-induced death protein 1-like n=1 Tax=Corythoichthys intestinalis TaxID=161448 RepID=UPI0025A57A1C|nr:required for drug-induced death protein 1-like [Corythoichthys intestinalis]XP_061806443.1 required for drug-induced death protein 1-like [Nerophis lumbriciformis]